MNTRLQNKRWLLLGSALLLVAACPGIARGQSGSKPAKAHADKALKEYNLGHFTEAVSEYEQAYEIDSAPILLFNIATAHRKAGNDEKALFFYGRYLDQAPDAPNRSEVEQRIRDLKAKIARQAETREKASTSPPPVAPIELPQVSSSVSSAPPLVTANAEPPPPHPDHQRSLRTAGWITGAGAVAALGVGVGLQLVADQKFSDFDKHCGVNEKGDVVPDAGGSATECASLHQKWEDSKTWPVVGYVAAGALGAASLTLFLLARPSHQPSADQTALVGCRAGLGTLMCRVVF